MELVASAAEHFHALFSFLPQRPAPDYGVALDLRGDAERCVLAFAALLAIDWLLIALRWFPSKQERETRYFSIHVLVNAFVVYQHFPDLVATYSDPSNAYLGPSNTRGCVAIFALHLYHMVFYQPLAVVDWIHHIVMIVVMLPMAYVVAPGYMLGHGCFYASGLPGGLDYILLIMIKLKLISKRTEKTLNCWIQLWIRAPGCVIHAWLSYHCWLNAHRMYYGSAVKITLPAVINPEYIYICCWVVIVTFFWNGLFFLDRVIRSHERLVVMDKLEQEGRLLLAPPHTNGHNNHSGNGTNGTSHSPSNDASNGHQPHNPKPEPPANGKAGTLPSHDPSGKTE